jgi:hypothetical protein
MSGKLQGWAHVASRLAGGPNLGISMRLSTSLCTSGGVIDMVDMQKSTIAG